MKELCVIIGVAMAARCFYFYSMLVSLQVM